MEIFQLFNHQKLSMVSCSLCREFIKICHFKLFIMELYVTLAGCVKTIWKQLIFSQHLKILSDIRFKFKLFNQTIGLMSRVFINGPEDWVSILGWVISKIQKMILDATFLNTQHYKVKNQDKAEESKEWNSILPYTSVY